jgi:hypothetical protein
MNMRIPVSWWAGVATRLLAVVVGGWRKHLAGSEQRLEPVPLRVAQRRPRLKIDTHPLVEAFRAPHRVRLRRALTAALAFLHRHLVDSSRKGGGRHRLSHDQGHETRGS